MAELRRPLEFGSFITPAASSPRGVVDLAVAADEAGLDLVTFQDHPYQPAFLDSWTLLAFVAARTSRVMLSPNVSNLPLRSPALMARAGASLDLLSDGRFSLALGAGAFWDGIVAMGGPRRTPGEAVTALEEAIVVIRTLWDVGSTDTTRFDGEFYSLAGAKRGPAPTHPIPIWLGAYGPRSLALTGTYGDGWLPTLSYLDSWDAISEANARIDRAAVEAGRDPAEIRRMLNIGPDLANPDSLARLATEHGIDTFVLMSDESETITHFGHDVAPAARALVGVS